MSRTADHPIDPRFLERWSPRAMSGEPLVLAELLRLFEAARWAPSSGNSQPWRFTYALAKTPGFDRYLELLDPGNREWCWRAGALVLVVARTQSDQGRPLRTHAFDTGAAWMAFALQGAAMNLVVHAMAGFDHDGAATVAAVPADHAIQGMVGRGPPGAPRRASGAAARTGAAESADAHRGARVAERFPP